jgi:hypothetical protein
LSSPFDGLKVIRERILVTHQSPYERTVVDEITLVNTSAQAISNVFVFKKDFMPSLKVLDESNTELPYHTNEFTKQLLGDFIDSFPNQNERLQTMLDQINNKQLFVVWIKLPDKDSVQSNNLKIIKLSYHDNRSIKAIKNRVPRKRFSPNLLEYVKREKFLFSIPAFPMDYDKEYGEQYDMFFVIYVPEGYILKYDIARNIKRNRIMRASGQTVEDISSLTRDDGYYENYHDRIISIRFPPIVSEIDFEMDYEIVPEHSERMFFTSIVTAMTIASLLFLWIAFAPLYNPNPPPIMRIIYPHLFALYGGTITAALATIGLMGKPFLGKTRFYLIAPAALSVVGFVIKELIALG